MIKNSELEIQKQHTLNDGREFAVKKSPKSSATPLVEPITQ